MLVGCDEFEKWMIYARIESDEEKRSSLSNLVADVLLCIDVDLAAGVRFGDSPERQADATSPV
jgi:hypothetical protein